MKGYGANSKNMCAARVTISSVAYAVQRFLRRGKLIEQGWRLPSYVHIRIRAEWADHPFEYVIELQAVVASLIAYLGTALCQLQAELSNPLAPRTRGGGIGGCRQKRH